MSKDQASANESKFIFSDLTWAMLMLRAWIGLRLVFAAIVKFKVVNPDGSAEIAFGNYAKWVEHTYKPFHEQGMLPEFMAKAFSGSIAYLLLLSGIMILLGVTNRIALLFGTAVMLSLSFGLFTIDDGAEIGYIAMQFGLFAAALALAKHNRLTVFGKF